MSEMILATNYNFEQQENYNFLFAQDGSLIADLPDIQSDKLLERLEKLCKTNKSQNILLHLIGKETFEKLRHASWQFTRHAVLPPTEIPTCGVWDISCFPTQLNGQTILCVSFTSSPIAIATHLTNSYQIAADATLIGVWDIRFIDEPRVMDESDCFQHILDNQFVFFSQTAKDILSLRSFRETTWRTVFNRIHPDDQVTFEQMFLGNLYHNIRLNFDCRIADLNKTYRWYTIRGESISNEQGLPLRMCGSVFECTEQKEMLNSILESENTKKLALETSGIGVWSGTSLDDLWTWDSNVAAIMNLGATYQGKLADLLNNVQNDDKKKLIDQFRNATNGNANIDCEVKVDLGDLGIHFVVIKGNVTKDIMGNVKRIDGICHDNSAERIASQKIKELNEALERTVKQRTKELIKARDLAESGSIAKSNFLAMMSHEIRTPMNGVIGALDLVERSQLNSEQLDLIHTAKTSALNLVDILNDILDLNKIEAGKMQLESTNVSISETIDNVVNMFLSIADNKNVKLTVEESNSIPNWVNTDPVRLRQILINFVSNAIKFCGGEQKAGHVHIQVSIDESQSFSSQKSVIFSVRDNGIGMTAKTIDKLFSPFTQAEASTTRKYGGTGLGLAICGRLCELMGGQIQVDSQVGEYSKFTIRLPLWETEQLADVSMLFGQLVYMQNLSASDSQLAWISERLEQLGAERVDKATQADIVLILANQTHQLIDIQRNIDQALQEFCTAQILLVCPRTLRTPLWKTWPELKIIASDPMTRYAFERVDLGTDSSSQAENHRATNSTAPEKASILLVEDNPLNQKLLLKQLAVLGLNADLAHDGRNGLNLFTQNSYKLILTDCHMPVMDGYSMAKNIREYETSQGLQTTPIIAITGAAMTGDKEKCIQSGMNDFLPKPIETHKLKAIVEKWHE
ncbi:PAS/PAC sensor-containing hybrid histidine kinase [Catenovulum agarivorans DS-2]|uniref:histidine kinase n=1 Tax=Catenovulum agarivorans DS-2 TaxID=1328313 RepID=W7R0A1_9ALTE|nr:ATP-binding protein [Catenovulum agarivorans]EWH11050.1 PAS/PAC sensor-containing hybrid histidine kinase [Catenovulum agarivorans DS-2]